ncbi:putative quinol monooxygenase [Shewanella woodyi]|uniref:putative quinol monooxygenase n=1 Tax=Shewanella woodyi TaxID=60961 RepID=UPI000A4C1702|nr:putative quinol monooxygenase [Shewanella woodyi]
MMGEHMIYLLARFKAQSGKEEALLELLKSVVLPTRSELGCVRYELHEESKEKGHFVFIKAFVDISAYEKHKNTRHYKIMMKEVPELITQKPEIIMLSKHL